MGQPRHIGVASSTRWAAHPSGGLEAKQQAEIVLSLKTDETREELAG